MMRPMSAASKGNSHDALIGPNADRVSIMGGGSARVVPPTDIALVMTVEMTDSDEPLDLGLLPD